ncbi:MAG: UDP-3-O-(3-hydroxymyristoyl)glucosamine N-acyltransferase [Candidatus Omnitrophica bacterium]|nr:UDP-3-O-(3-hydroxymyristoyl)glucosamine N-acyltransferase [Candidatus Omnitrophota bacterium]
MIPERNLLRVDNPRLAFLKVMYLFQPAPSFQTGVNQHAVIAPDAELGEGVTVRECAVIRSHARIGRETIVEGGAQIGERVSIGERCFIGPNVVVMRDCHIGNRVIIHGGTVVGADGFGYFWAENRHMKIPQLGNVVIEDDVEIGANVCVDRATLGSTIIRRGTKIDNLVQIAHNDIIGQDVIICGQAGLAGSVTIGNRVMLAGQAGVVDHTAIGDGARVGAATPVTKDIKAGESVWGFPARSAARVKRELASLAQLPRLLQRFKELRSRLDEIGSRVALLEQRSLQQPVQDKRRPPSFNARLIALGEILFRNRSWTPIPLLALLIFCRFKEMSWDLVTWVPGLLLLVLGEGLRIWSVAVIGKESRTRGSGVERLVTFGPYAYVRNPLYVGNFLLTMGAVCISELLWAVPIVLTLFVAQYLPIVLWEERLLLKRFGADYTTYCQRVPRWFPRWRSLATVTPRGTYHWRASLWSERTTFGALACLLLLMIAKENAPHLPKYFRKHPFRLSNTHRIP